jgi:predicted metal-binding membrane protein
VVNRWPALEAVVWRHPEWWSVVLSALAWLLLAAPAASGAGGVAGLHRHEAGPPSVAPGPAGSDLAWIPGVLSWLMMVVAMMVPLVLAQIRFTAARSLWRRRHRAIVGFLVGYLSLWLMVGLGAAALPAALGLDGWLRGPWAGALGFSVAAAWQLTPLKWRALRGCHRTMPLAPRGWQADRDCVRYGWLVGGQCLLSCWALMLACMLAGHGVLALAGVTIVTAAERYPRRPDQRVVCGLLASLGALHAIV